MNKPNTLSQRLDYSNSSYNNENVILEYLAVCVLEELVFKREKYGLLADIY